MKLNVTEQRIRRHYSALVDGHAPPLALQIVQAPVFHGYVVSVLVEIGSAVTVAKVEAALAGDRVDLVSAESDPPSNLSAAGQPDMLVRVGKDWTARTGEPILDMDGCG